MEVPKNMLFYDLLIGPSLTGKIGMKMQEYSFSSASVS